MAGTEALAASMSPRESTSASSPYNHKPTKKSSPRKTSLSYAFHDLRSELELASSTITQLSADKATLKLALRTANETKAQLQAQLHEANLLARQLTKENSSLRAKVDLLKTQVKEVSGGQTSLAAENQELRRLTDELETEIRDLDVDRESLRRVMTHGRVLSTGQSLSLGSYLNFLKNTLPECGRFAAIFKARGGLGEFEGLLGRKHYQEALLKLMQIACDFISAEVLRTKRKEDKNEIAESRRIGDTLKASFTVSRRPT